MADRWLRSTCREEPFMSEHSVDYELSILSSMVDKLRDYLEDDRLFKTITAYTPQGERLLKMTLGGIFQRIEELREAALDEEQREELTDLQAEVAQVRQQQADAFYKKLNRELKSYIDSWRWFLQNCWEGDAKCLADYPQEVDLRQRVDALLRIAGERVNPDEARRIAELDQRLRRQWEPGNFLLSPAEQSRYPETTYWWLYGRPRPGVNEGA
jgi:hypothetical protein